MFPDNGVLAEKMGEQLAAWARGGKVASPPIQPDQSDDGLVDRSRVAALDGMSAYEAFFKALPRDQQVRLVDSGEHEKNKDAAKQVDAAVQP